MKIDDLISELEELKEKHGNLEVQRTNTAHLNADGPMNLSGVKKSTARFEEKEIIKIY